MGGKLLEQGSRLPFLTPGVVTPWGRRGTLGGAVASQTQHHVLPGFGIALLWVRGSQPSGAAFCI